MIYTVAHIACFGKSTCITGCTLKTFSLLGSLSICQLCKGGRSQLNSLVLEGVGLSSTTVAGLFKSLFWVLKFGFSRCHQLVLKFIAFSKLLY